MQVKREKKGKTVKKKNSREKYNFFFKEEKNTFKNNILILIGKNSG